MSERDTSELMWKPDQLSDGNIIGIIQFQDKIVVACQRSVWCFYDGFWRLANAIDGSVTEQMIRDT